MSGATLPVLPKRLLDFSTLPVSGQQELVIADRVPLEHWRELTLRVRVHSHTLTGTNTITIKVYPQSWSMEDPGMQFVAAVAVQQAVGASTPSPGLLSIAVPVLGTGHIASMARITAAGSRTGGGTMQASVSLEFAGKVA